ncbi:MAG: hypothetical protein M3N43_03245, partial [Actinomycetota bacterium]|nr:hypothetical protein [Actinomycetota bacterium]
MRWKLGFAALVAILLGVLVGAIVFALVPVEAVHVTEPTLPLTGMRVQAYEYPNLQATLLRCDGTDKTTINNLRVEPLVTFAKDG